MNKRQLKNILGDLPMTAEIYWLMRQRGRPLSRSFSLSKIEKKLPEWKKVVEESRITLLKNGNPVTHTCNIMIFATLRYWIEHGVLLGMGLVGQGHQVTLAYLPYANWQRPLNRFDQRRQDLYARHILQKCSPVMEAVSFYNGEADPDRKTLKRPYGLPDELVHPIEELSIRDVQYTLQIEEVDFNNRLHSFRLGRNVRAAQAALEWIKSTDHPPEVILVPNGSILEMGAIYAVARYLKIPVVTYEFGEQRERIWLALNSEVMLQETDQLWAHTRDLKLSDEQWEKIRSLFSARRGASLWQNFSRQWQGEASQGGEAVLKKLNLDDRPIVLLAANVIGDSLTLGRQVFSRSMTEWLERTIQYFLKQPANKFQLVIRIHPGEKITKGPSVANIVRRICPQLPENFRLIEAADPTNTYDIAGVAVLGLVYTTTTGMEMAMGGVPVIVAGKTHYRGKGFTLDPQNWDEYYSLIDDVLSRPASWRQDQEKLDLAWRYAYRFFFDYPLPFPWRLINFWEELADHPLEQVLSKTGQALYSQAFHCLAGQPRQWNEQPDAAIANTITTLPDIGFNPAFREEKGS
jgi:hypothetical protein